MGFWGTTKRMLYWSIYNYNFPLQSEDLRDPDGALIRPSFCVNRNHFRFIKHGGDQNQNMREGCSIGPGKHLQTNSVSNWMEGHLG